MIVYISRIIKNSNYSQNSFADEEDVPFREKLLEVKFCEEIHNGVFHGLLQWDHGKTRENECHK